MNQSPHCRLLCALAAIIAGFGVAYLPDFALLTLLITIAIVFSGGVAAVKRRLSLPFLSVLLAFTFYAVLQPVQASFRIMGPWLSDVQELTGPAIVALLALLGFAGGYLPGRRNGTSGEQRRKLPIVNLTQGGIALLLAALLAYGYTVISEGGSGFNVFADDAVYGRGRGHAKQTLGYITVLTQLTLPGATLVGLSMPALSGVRRMIDCSVTLLVVGIVAGGGTRFGAVGALFCFVAAWAFAQGRLGPSDIRPRQLVRVVPLLLGCGVLILAVGALRGDKSAANISRPPTARAADAFFGAGDLHRPLGSVMSDTEGFLYGESFLAALAGPIPRAIWPEKPISPTLEALYRSVDAQTGAAMPAYGEYWLNFGYPGALIVPIFLGALLRRFESHLRKSGRTLVLVPLAPLCFLIVGRGLFESHLYGFLVIVVPVYCMLPRFAGSVHTGGSHNSIAVAR